MPCYELEVEKKTSNSNVSNISNRQFTLVLIGNPNVGKSSLFNSLTGLNSHTANFPGTTVERKVGRIKNGKEGIEIIDLPGICSLQPATAEERVASEVLLGHVSGVRKPDAVVIVADATNLERSLFLFSKVSDYNLPVFLVVNMIDVADKRGININFQQLSRELGCPVIPTIARTGQGLEDLLKHLEKLKDGESASQSNLLRSTTCSSAACTACPFQSSYTWSETVTSRCVKTLPVARGSRTESIDKVLTHPLVGIGAFFTVIFSVFYLIFSVANIPMDLIDTLFARIGHFISALIPAGKIQSLIVDGILGGVGGMLVFLPQICILFFCLSLLEDSGYLARAAFVMDRLMGKVGLPGTAFVPLLSAHACAIPAIMATRVIRNTRDRLVTILVAPLMSCSARIPVYAMVTALLFPHEPGKAALVFTGAYTLGIIAAIVMAFIFKKTILPGESKPLVLELPDYRIPAFNTAFKYTWDRGKVFVGQAGTIILGMSVVLWALATFPDSEPSDQAIQMRNQAEILTAMGKVEQAHNMEVEAEAIDSRHHLSGSFAGRLGKIIEPVVRPLGFDWQIGIGVITSFAAREVIVSTLAIVYGVGAKSADDNPSGLYETLGQARRNDGTPVFNTATSMSLLVFYVLAMQCLPTQAVTKRETNSIKWAIFQFAYMTILAYIAAFFTFNFVSILT